jgi:tetratricopeptide (TPR) repeat protein
MPMTVWLRHTNLYTCSPFWSFEQAQLFQKAIEAGRKARSPNREAEATNNLGVLFAREGSIDEAYKSFVRAIRLYRNGGQRRRAVSKALDLARQFEILGQYVREKYFVDIASTFSDGDDDASVKARVTLEQGRYYLHSDLKLSQASLQQAHSFSCGVWDRRHDQLSPENDSRSRRSHVPYRLGSF